ncbi:hypothetical protein DA075_19270 [Methylobacterium currus]|uniref:Phage tail protein n=1 Tax=Methylobacterium currus TaxID=2051553 RepID=A0A2R4WMM2_9HYPH|nr:phage tail protein [Methylobacterium currus]AWB22784.1 hypothetical protein DA075_19270 [Methylobacterium currus]
MGQADFRHLNREGRWLGWRLSNVTVDGDGRATLTPLAAGPGVTAPAGEVPAPAGVLKSGNGALWWSSPATGTLCRIGPCGDDDASRAGPELVEPRGLAAARERGLVWLADPGLSRVLLLRSDGSLVQTVGAPGAPGGPGAPPGTLSGPSDVETDARGAVYVLDPPNARIQKFSPTGQVRSAFWRRMRDDGLVRDPRAIASRDGPDGFELLVLDGAARAVFAFDEAGVPVGGDGRPLDLGAAGAPTAICASGRLLYVGDAARNAILAFRLDGGEPAFAGTVPGYAGPVSALSAGADGDVWALGAGGQPVRLAASGGFGTRGAMWTGPVSAREPQLVWSRLRSTIDPLGEHSAFRIYVATSRGADAPPVDPAAPEPFGPPWRAFAPNVAAGYIGAEPAPNLWVGIVLSGDGRGSPQLSQLRVEYNQLSYLPLLPRIYREPSLRETDRDDFLLRFLSLVESFVDDASGAIASLDRLFAADGAPPEALPWLAELLGLAPAEDWSVAKLRRAVAGASAADALRGTAAGLGSSLIEAIGGVAPVIEDGAGAGIWIAPGAASSDDAGGSCGGSCGCGGACDGAGDGERTWIDSDDARLGFTTYLAAVEPYGAVLDVSATLDHTHLIDEDAVFEPLFAETASRVSIRLPPGALTEEHEAAIRAVLAREGPAHVSFEIRSAAAGGRLGLAMLGVETVLGGPPPPAALGGAPRGRVGQGLEVGRAATL